MSANGGVDWHLIGDEVGSCNCVWACPCQFEGDPSEGDCKALIGYKINQGHFGEVNLDGVNFAGAVSWPGPIYEGDGTVQLYIDESTTDEQRDAVIKLNSGEYGGSYFEIFASVLPHVREPVVAPIAIECDRDSRTGTVRVGELASLEIQPIKSPASGEEHRVRIDLPNGFEYKQAEIANTVAAGVSGNDPLSFELENSYGQLNPIDWSPAGIG
jgi:hypothetical protein